MQKMLEEHKNWIDTTWSNIEQKLGVTCIESRNKIPYSTVNGIHDDCSGAGSRKIDWWTNGFWPGMMWLLYAATKEEKYKITAEHAEELLDTALNNYSCLHHDVGFMWLISSCANYKLTGNQKSKDRTLMAAATLASRYNTDGQFIRAWNGIGNEGWAIIDCMMNIPLLYWASETIGDPRFLQIAMHFADKTLKHHIRPDGSVYHILEYDTVTGEVIGTPDGQGYDAACSSWSRGQSWAIYGFVISYLHTKEQRYLDAAKQVAHYFISAVCHTGYIPKCDFRSPEQPDYIDTVAGAIAACGLIEIAKVVPKYEKALYFHAAISILKALEKDHCNWTSEEQSILQNGTERYGDGIHKPIIYGDYYFVEAMYKLKGYPVMFW